MEALRGHTFSNFRDVSWFESGFYMPV
jgi:hypothetical protein